MEFEKMIELIKTVSDSNLTQFHFKLPPSHSIS